MALPPEIRLRIFKLVCGSKMVHIGPLSAYHRRWKFARVRKVCRVARSENEIYENLMSSGIMSEPQRGEKVHSVCEISQEPAFDLGLLTVNKKIYQEAKFLAVQTVTFSFAERWNIGDEEHRVIQDFVNYMPQEQLKHIRKVRLAMKMVDAASEAKWKKTIEESVLRKMPNIHHLYVHLNVGAALCWTQRHENDEHVQELDWMKPVFALRRLDLQSVRVIIADAKGTRAASTTDSHPRSRFLRCHRKYCLGAAAHEVGHKNSFRLRRDVKQRYAEYIKRKLLKKE